MISIGIINLKNSTFLKFFKLVFYVNLKGRRLMKKIVFLTLGTVIAFANDWSLEGINFSMDKKQLTEKGFKCGTEYCTKEFKSEKGSLIKELKVFQDNEGKAYKITGQFEKFHGVQDTALMNALKQKYKTNDDVDVKIDYWYYNGTPIYSMVWATSKQRESAYFNYLEKEYLSKLK